MGGKYVLSPPFLDSKYYLVFYLFQYTRSSHRIITYLHAFFLYGKIFGWRELSVVLQLKYVQLNCCFFKLVNN